MPISPREKSRRTRERLAQNPVARERALQLRREAYQVRRTDQEYRVRELRRNQARWGPEGACNLRRRTLREDRQLSTLEFFACSQRKCFISWTPDRRYGEKSLCRLDVVDSTAHARFWPLHDFEENFLQRLHQALWNLIWSSLDDRQVSAISVVESSFEGLNTEVVLNGLGYITWNLPGEFDNYLVVSKQDGQEPNLEVVGQIIEAVLHQGQNQL
jgi:hypothetical protein